MISEYYFAAQAGKSTTVRIQTAEKLDKLKTNVASVLRLKEILVGEAEPSEPDLKEVLKSTARYSREELLKRRRLLCAGSEDLNLEEKDELLRITEELDVMDKQVAEMEKDLKASQEKSEETRVSIIDLPCL